MPVVVLVGGQENAPLAVPGLPSVFRDVTPAVVQPDGHTTPGDQYGRRYCWSLPDELLGWVYWSSAAAEGTHGLSDTRVQMLPKSGLPGNSVRAMPTVSVPVMQEAGAE